MGVGRCIVRQRNYIRQNSENALPIAGRRGVFKEVSLAMFITEAYAQGAAPGGGNLLFQLLPFIMILGIMYFLIIRPQQKRLKEHREMIGSLRRGDTVVTAGGMVGKVTKLVGDAELQVELADGVRVRVIRNTIAEVRTRGDVREVAARQALARKDDDADDDADNDNVGDEGDKAEATGAKSGS